MSPSIIDFFKDKGKNVSKFEVLYNWARVNQITKDSSHFRRQLKLEDKIVFFYGGTIGRFQQIINMVNLAKKFVENSDVHFLFVGQGDEVELLLSEARKFKLNNITYLPPVNQNTYSEMLNEFDIGLFSLNSAHKTHNIPGKLLGYMSQSKPILGCVNEGNDTARIINSAKAGIVVNSNDDLGLFRAAETLIEFKSTRTKMGKNAKKLLSSQFSVKSISKQILNFFE